MLLIADLIDLLLGGMYYFLYFLVGFECADGLQLLDEGLQEGLSPGRLEIGVPEFLCDCVGEELEVRIFLKCDPVEIRSHYSQMQYIMRIINN